MDEIEFELGCDAFGGDPRDQTPRVTFLFMSDGSEPEQLRLFRAQRSPLRKVRGPEIERTVQGDSQIGPRSLGAAHGGKRERHLARFPIARRGKSLRLQRELHA